MPKRKISRNNVARVYLWRKRRLAVAITLALMCIVSASLLAQVNSRRKRNTPSGEVSVSSLSPGSPSKEYIYVGGRLVATEEPMVTTLSPPSALSATVSSSNPGQIDLSWTASAGGVDHYQIERSSNFSATGNGFSFVANGTASTTYSDTPPGNGVRGFMYR